MAHHGPSCLSNVFFPEEFARRAACWNSEEKQKTGGQRRIRPLLTVSFKYPSSRRLFTLFYTLEICRIQLEPKAHSSRTPRTTTRRQQLRPLLSGNRVSTGVGCQWSRGKVKIPRRRNSLPPFLLQWLRATVSACYISKVLTIIQLLLDSTWEPAARVIRELGIKCDRRKGDS